MANLGQGPEHNDGTPLRHSRFGRAELRHPEEENQLLNYGWCMRIMYHDSTHGPADFRTYGLKEKFGHPEIQIYYPLPPNLAVCILAAAVDQIKSGRLFQPGSTSVDVLDDYTVKFVDATVGGVKVLRLILPDKDGRFKEGEITGTYALQYRQLHELP